MNILEECKRLYELRQKNAEQGVISAQVELGEVYYSVKDYKSCVKWLEKAAEQGYVGSSATLGRAYYQLKDYELSEKWLTKAAESGDVQAMVDIGLMYSKRKYFEDIYGDTKYEKAFKWFSLAAKHNNKDALRALGCMYLRGLLGGIGDYEKAFQFYKKAIRKDDNTICELIGEMYMYGLGVEQNLRQAKRYYKKAAIICKKKVLTRKSEDYDDWDNARSNVIYIRKTKEENAEELINDYYHYDWNIYDYFLDGYKEEEERRMQRWRTNDSWRNEIIPYPGLQYNDFDI